MHNIIKYNIIKLFKFLYILYISITYSFIIQFNNESHKQCIIYILTTLY